MNWRQGNPRVHKLINGQIKHGIMGYGILLSHRDSFSFLTTMQILTLEKFFVKLNMISFWIKYCFGIPKAFTYCDG